MCKQRGLDVNWAKPDTGATPSYAAAEQGHVVAMFNLANMYQNGSGIKKDIEMAKKWYTKAVELGDKDAQAELDKLHEDPW